MKSTILLAMALFLVSAPAPDSGDIADLTSNFMVPRNSQGPATIETGILLHDRIQLATIA